MKVGVVAAGLKEFLADLESLLSDARTVVFVDSSLLIDNLKLGPKALDELHGYLETTLKGRLHVPLWAAHEFHQHLVKGTAASQTSMALRDMERVGQRLYKEIAPALSEAADTPTRTAEQHRLLVRSALQDLTAAAKLLQNWTKRVQPESQKKVVDFVNSHCLRSHTIFGYLKWIDSLAGNRYEGRIPPGFQDRNKPVKAGQDGGASEGSNAAGDLMFWKEILDYVKAENRWYLQKFNNILILTNDEKNDWTAGRGTQATPSDNTFKDADTVWDPLPIPHPMLEFEATTVCKVSRVALCTGHLLGAFLSTKGLTPTFVLSRFQIGLTKGQPKGTPAKLPIEMSRSGPAVGTAPAGPPAKSGASPPDAVGLSGEQMEPLPTPAELLTFLSGPTAGWNAEVDAKIERLKAISSATAEESVQDILQIPKEFATGSIAALLGRRMMQLSDSHDPSARDSLQLILKVLPELAPSTAAWFYAGVLFGKYVSNGQIRLTPPHLLLEDIVAFEPQASASPGINLIEQIAQAQASRPLYLPNIESKPLTVNLIAEFGRAIPPRLSALTIGELDVFSDVASSDEAEIWRLRELHEPMTMTLTPQDLISLASRYYGIPSTRLRPSHSSEQVVVGAEAGFTQVEELAYGG